MGKPLRNVTHLSLMPQGVHHMVSLQACISRSATHTLDTAPACCPNTSLMKLVLTGGMAVLVTMLDVCPDASPLICALLFCLTASQDLPDHQVRLVVRPSTHASLLSQAPVYVKTWLTGQRAVHCLHTCTLQLNRTLLFRVCIYLRELINRVDGWCT